MTNRLLDVEECCAIRCRLDTGVDIVGVGFTQQEARADLALKLRKRASVLECTANELDGDS